MADVGEPGPEPEEELPEEPVWPGDAAAPELEMPTAEDDVPGWGCLLAVLLLIILIVLGAGYYSGFLDSGDAPPVTTTEAAP